STISSALFCGLKRDSAVEYSFILGIPVIAAGTLLSLKDIGAESLNQIEVLPLVIGFVVSAVAGVLAIKLIKWLVEKNRFKIFSFYTLILGVATIAIGICEKIYNFRFILEL
ncbi:MAG: undecaprenyl-diphosphate phosphatase, partial [Oscillospiraceae bacterium]|nr:undecaprenyl-diphosphate phosphatase [Oscillospiraceae bacterium]